VDAQTGARRSNIGVERRGSGDINTMSAQLGIPPPAG